MVCTSVVPSARPERPKAATTTYSATVRTAWLRVKELARSAATAAPAALCASSSLMPSGCKPWSSGWRRITIAAG